MARDDHFLGWGGHSWSWTTDPGARWIDELGAAPGSGFLGAGTTHPWLKHKNEKKNKHELKNLFIYSKRFNTNYGLKKIIYEEG